MLNWGERSAAACYPWASLPSPFPLGDGLTRRFRLPLLQTAMYHTSGNAILFCILTRIIPNVPDILPSR
nr:MAG TPA: hypothetical protein [Caudoviricetes sp.]